MSELKQCPFCGGQSTIEPRLLVDGSTRWAIECSNDRCLATGPYGTRREEAIAAWTMPLALIAAVRAEREACAMVAFGEAPDATYDPTDEAEGYARACHQIAKMIRSRGPAPAVDVIGVVREYVNKLDEYRKRNGFPGPDDHDFELDSIVDAPERALRSLVPGAAANDKGEGR